MMRNDYAERELSDGGHEAHGLEQERGAAVLCSALLTTSLSSLYIKVCPVSRYLVNQHRWQKEPTKSRQANLLPTCR